MAWTAKLVSIPQNPAPTDSISIQVQFYDPLDNTKVPFTKDINLSASNITALADVKAIIVQQLAALNKFEAVKGVLNTQINKDF